MYSLVYTSLNHSPIYGFLFTLNVKLYNNGTVFIKLADLLFLLNWDGDEPLKTDHLNVNMEVMFSVKLMTLIYQLIIFFIRYSLGFLYIKLPKGLSFIAFHSLICIRNGVDTVEMVFLKTISLKLLCW